MPLLTPALLDALELNLDEDTRKMLDHHVETTLEERVIDTMVSELNAEQLVSLNNLEGDDDDLQNWIATNVPDFDEIVKNEIDILIAELAENSQSIN